MRPVIGLQAASKQGKAHTTASAGAERRWKQMNKQKSVLFLESSKNMGGQEWQLLQQMQALQQEGYLSVLLCAEQGLIAAHAKARNLHVITLPFRNSAHLPTVRGIWRAIKQYQPTACICHSGHDANNLSIACLWLRQRPKIIRSRTYYTNDKKKSWQSLLPLDVVMVPSQFMQAQIQKQFPSKRVEVVYPGVDFAKLDGQTEAMLSEDLQQWLAARPAAEVIIQVGMFRREKGHHIVLAAVAQLLERHPNLVLILAGGGKKQAILEQIAQLGLSDKVWLGELSAVAPALRRAQLLVMPSLLEPLGMVQIEALGLGVPVIVSNVGGIPETVQHQQTGLIVTEATPEAWATAMDYGLTHTQEMQRLAAAGQEQVRQQFSRQYNTQRLLQLLSEAA